MMKNAIAIFGLVVLIAIAAVACSPVTGDGERDSIFEIGSIRGYEVVLSDGTRCLVAVNTYSNDAIDMECDSR